MNRPSTESLVRQIAGIASPKERAAFIERACAGDDELRERVMSQLDAVERTRSSPVDAAPAKAEVYFPPINRGAEAVTTEQRGDTIGRYRLIQEIGEGGCGTVFLAEQEEPVRRQVALKVIKLGMDTRQVVARFEVERQALAMMDHPNIARVLDAGATDTGRPFFVMELVRGINITEFCDQNRLKQSERIELFIKVCRAIQHAHQKGVIHRDIKPSNILVSLHDGVAVPKVIDFGIAKAMDESLPRNTLLTPYQAFIGTPAYASPEQADAAGLDVDTRSDIYSLGAVLYELLTGYQPFDQDKFVETGLVGVRRVICETDPLRPSTRLRNLDRAKLAAVARTRHAEPERLPTQMRGDLDWIVMKCLEKDRARRYETANGLAADLRRYLQNEPVVARPPTTTYVLQKLMRRHRLVFAAGSAVAASLVIGLATSMSLYFRERAAKHQQELLQKEADVNARRAGINAEKARSEAAKSREVSLFMKEMIESVGPVAMASESTAWRQIVDKAAERIGTDELHPAVEWELRTTLGEVYSSLGQRRRAIDMHREALRLARRHAELAPFKVIDSLVNLGWHLSQGGQAQAADPLLREAVQLGAQSYPQSHPRLTWIKGRLGWNLMSLRQMDEAEAVCREALEKARQYWKSPGASRDELPASLSSFATAQAYVMQLRGRTAEAEALFREALDAARRDKGDDHPDLRAWMHNLASFLLANGKRDEAEILFRSAWDIAQRHTPNHPGQISGAGSLAMMLRERGDDAEADEIISRLIATAKSLAERDRFVWANGLASLGMTAAWRDYSKDAVLLLESASQLGSDNEQIPAYLMAVSWSRKDAPALRAAFTDFVSRLGKPGLPDLALSACEALAMSPSATGDAQALRRLADAARASTEPAGWRFAALALADYRLEQFDTAAGMAAKAAVESEPGPRAAGNCVLALCRRRAGQHAEARASLAAAREVISTWPSSDAVGPNTRWLDLFVSRVLLQEAAAAVEDAGSAKAH